MKLLSSNMGQILCVKKVPFCKSGHVCVCMRQSIYPLNVGHIHMLDLIIIVSHPCIAIYYIKMIVHACMDSGRYMHKATFKE